MRSVDIEIVREIRNLLQYQRGCGLKGYPASTEVTEFLRTAPVQENPRPEAFQPPQSPPALAATGEADSEKNPETMEEIAQEVISCRACNLHHHRLQPVPGSGGGRVRLFIVGGWLQTESGQDPLIFGMEEDRMVEKMLAAIHIAPDEAYVTNAIKCGIAPGVQPQAENIASCFSYLQRQIAVSSPVVICTMGIVATRTLLHASKPLSQLRGRFHSFRLGRDRIIPVMPTYHPSFLLSNPEMKKATWADLQLIAQELGK